MTNTANTTPASAAGTKPAASPRPVGRPRIGEAVHVRLPAELATAIDAAAAKRGQSRSDAIREALERAFVSDAPKVAS
jgi:hypothetical protein